MTPFLFVTNSKQPNYSSRWRCYTSFWISHDINKLFQPQIHKTAQNVSRNSKDMIRHRITGQIMWLDDPVGFRLLDSGNVFNNLILCICCLRNSNSWGLEAMTTCASSSIPGDLSVLCKVAQKTLQHARGLLIQDGVFNHRILLLIPV